MTQPVRPLLDKIAGKVVCTRKPFVFTVDGEDFPWYISERGPLFSQVTDDLFVVDVQIIQLDKESKEFLPFGYIDEGMSVPSVPVIGGVEFPWLLTEDDITLTFGHKRCPELALKFFAHEVETDLWVDDKRQIFCSGGNLIASLA